ncbi:MAG: hypothetical protein ACJ77F_14145 [Chloroflexota bacterium]
MDTIEWLLDADPSIRWQVMRDVTDEPADAVARERARVATEGWGARLLALQAPDGQWGGGTHSPVFVSTLFTLLTLRDLGLDPASEQARRAVALVHANSRWDYDPTMKFFEGEVEPCVNGKAVALGAYFGVDVRRIVDRLLTEQMADGGWNCEQENGSTVGSFNTTIDVLEGLLEYERATGDPRVSEPRRRGEEYLLARRLFRRLSTGEVVKPEFLEFSFPTRWFYDVLRGLEYFRSTGARPNGRATEAIELVERKRDGDGRWPLENTHPGKVYFEMEDGDGRPSRWNTLRAMRVLRWWDGRLPEPAVATAAGEV